MQCITKKTPNHQITQNPLSATNETFITPHIEIESNSWTNKVKEKEKIFFHTFYTMYSVSLSIFECQRTIYLLLLFASKQEQRRIFHLFIPRKLYLSEYSLYTHSLYKLYLKKLLFLFYYFYIFFGNSILTPWTTWRWWQHMYHFKQDIVLEKREIIDGSIDSGGGSNGQTWNSNKRYVRM